MDTPTTTGFGAATGTTGSTTPGTSTASELCAHCGQPIGGGNRGLEQFLAKVGITDEMIDGLKNSFQNVDIEEYLNTARDYLRNAGDKVKPAAEKAKTFSKENPGKVAAGVAVLAVGTGLLISALNKDK
ncbi:MAG TPA: hypothetical protein VF057_05945 [Thermoanaerobaculia bacterium]